METEGSTSPKPKSKDPFLSLPSDVLVKIIGYTPVGQWPSLELLDKNFRAATLIAWRQLRNINLDRDFLMNYERRNGRPTVSACFESILQKLVECSPFLSSISGIVLQSANATLNSDAIHSLAHFEHLQSITMGDDQRETPFENVVDFLESTRSRTSLRELRLFWVVLRHADDPTAILERFASSFVNGRDIQSPLKLETFAFESSLSRCLDTMDATRLIDVCLRKAHVEPDQLANLIERAPHLERIELSFLDCLGDCNGPRLQANKKLLSALASCENLTAMMIDCLDPMLFDWDRCTNFAPEFIDMLETIGRRGKLRKLTLDDRCMLPVAFDHMDRVFATILKYIPYLQSIKLRTMMFNQEDFISSLVDRLELEDIDIPRTFTPATMQKIAHLPRLKRLAVKYINCDQHMNSYECLANASTLMDLRIGCARWITGDIFDRWADGFGSNLEILMLEGIAEEDKHAEDGLVRLLEKAVKLRVLILCGPITDRSLMAIANSCPKLETFGVRSISKEITALCLQEIIDRCPKLKRLGEFREVGRLQVPKYRKISGVVDMGFWRFDFDDGIYD